MSNIKYPVYARWIRFSNENFIVKFDAPTVGIVIESNCHKEGERSKDWVPVYMSENWEIIGNFKEDQDMLTTLALAKI